MEVHSRKLLSQTNLMPPSPTISPTQHNLQQTRPETPARAQPGSQFCTFNAGVILVLSILLCGLICALTVNAVVRCILRVTCHTCDQEPPGSPANDEIRTQPSSQIRRKEALFLPRLVYSSKLEITGSECTVCLSEFKRGVHVRVLPVCNHGFHVRCIDKWLSRRATCPTCRQCLFGTCRYEVGQVGPEVDQARVELATIASPEERMQP